MIPRSQQQASSSRIKWLTQALILSGALNIGFLATFASSALGEKQQNLKVTPLRSHQAQPFSSTPSNGEVLYAYSQLPFPELILRLENKELIEEGLSVRDLALACLVAFHHFNLDRALGAFALQKRFIPLLGGVGEDPIKVPVFPGLADYQFQAILYYAKTEKWPFTSQGLFYELKRAGAPFDPSLLEAFCLTPEHYTIHSLFSKFKMALSKEQSAQLIAALPWSVLADFVSALRRGGLSAEEGRRAFLIAALEERSPLAAHLLLESELEFTLKKLSDGQILMILDLCGEGEKIDLLARSLLSSPRTDGVWKAAASKLYAQVGESLPDPYSHETVLRRFLPKLAPQAPPEVKPQVVAPAPSVKKRTHTIEVGDSLWKIARKYKVGIEEIKKLNHLETEKLRVGRQLEIPQGT